MLHLTSKINNETFIEIGKVILDIYFYLNCIQQQLGSWTWFTLCCNKSELCPSMRVCHKHFALPHISGWLYWTIHWTTLVIVCF